MKEITIRVPDNCELKQDGNTYTIVEREKKPAWSEEDEIRAAQIISDLEKCTVPGFPVYIGGVELEVNWLKSLKERMK